MELVRSDNLRRLLFAMSEPGTFYVLGAGASAGLVPFTPGTFAFVRQRYLDIGMYSAMDAPRSPLLDRVVLEPMVSEWKLGGCRWHPDDLLVERIPLSTLELLAQKAWSPRLHGKAPPQYSVLQKVAGPAVFFTFNLDGLARWYLRDEHFVFEPHGTVDRLWTESLEFEELLERSLDVRLPSVAPKLLPGPELSQITSARPYVEARTYLRTAPAVVILGYSFGTFRGKMDDSESFEYLLDAVAKRQCPIFVVDPNADWLASSIEERLRCRRVVSVALRWDDFSSTVLAMMGRHNSLSALSGDRQLNAVIAAYGLRLDKRA
jgi:hypothetical protein